MNASLSNSHYRQALPVGIKLTDFVTLGRHDAGRTLGLVAGLGIDPVTLAVKRRKSTPCRTFGVYYVWGSCTTLIFQTPVKRSRV